MMIVDTEQLRPYLDQDCDLIPLHQWNKQTTNKGKTQQRGKTPLNNNWTTATKDLAKTLSLAKKGYNVGYRLSATDIIVDVDPRNFDLDDSLDLLCEFLGVTDLAEHYPTVLTGGGGYHFYMTKPANLHVRETLEDYPGIEFKTSGRQVVAAGSKHPSGEYYMWDDFSVPLAERKQAPNKLLKLLKRSVPTTQAAQGTINNSQLEQLLEQLPIEEFGTNDAWFPLMCAAHHGTGGTGVQEFVDWSMGDAKYADDEHAIKTRWESLGGKSLNYTVNTLYKTVLSYGGSTAMVSAQKDFENFDTTDPEDLPQEDADLLEEDLDEEDFDDVLKIPNLDEGFKPGVALNLANKLTPNSSEEDIIIAIRASLQASTLEKTKVGKILQSKLGIGKGELNEITKQIKEQLAEDLGRILAEKTLELKFYNGKGLIYHNSGQFWAYDGKYWSTITKQYVGGRITEVLDKLRKKIDINVKENAIVNEALGIIERLCATRGDVLRLREKPYPVINCTNGELWIKKDGQPVLRKHKPNSYLLQVLGVEYSPGAECPLFDKSIRETFGRFEDAEDIVRHFEEYMGYTLHPDKRPAHWWLFKGPGGDGKTTLLRIICGLLGDAVLPESIEKFRTGGGGDNHSSANLVGKLLVYDDDLNRNATLPDGTLKQLSEDGETTANPKGVAAFRFTRVCTVTMLSNGYPKTKDVTRGFRRRAMVIPFNRGFHENGAIVDLAEQIVKTELAGVLNRALQGLQRLRERGVFLEPKSCKIAKTTWLQESNTVALFIEEKVDVTGKRTDVVALTDAYVEYNTWCNTHGINRVETKQQFRAVMEDMDVAYQRGADGRGSFFGINIPEEDVGDFDEFGE